MQWFKFHIGDYQTHTKHLSIIEDIAYRRMLDLYYLGEAPLPKEHTDIARLLCMRDHEAEVKAVLEEFFHYSDDTGMWHNHRADAEIEAYQSRSRINSINGRKGAGIKRATSESLANGERVESEGQANKKKNKNSEEEKEKHNIHSDHGKRDHVPYAAIVDLYHELLPELPKVEKLTTKRKGYISARWKSGDIATLDDWRDYFEFIRLSPFLMGKVDPANGRKRFIANLEWITNETNFAKIWERKYHE